MTVSAHGLNCSQPMTSLVPDKSFHFTCFNVEDTDDPRAGLRNGDLTIPGQLLRQEVFDPVVQQVCGNPHHGKFIGILCLITTCFAALCLVL